MYNPQLETFLCVVEAGNFNKAAEKLYISPPSRNQTDQLAGGQFGSLTFCPHTSRIDFNRGWKIPVSGCKYIIQYCRDSVTRVKNAMHERENVIRIETSPMTPTQVLVDFWPKVQEHCPEIKFQLVPFENTPENAREILANLGQNIDVIAGAFDETMLNLRKCAGLEISKEPICCAVSIHHRLAQKD